MDVGRIKGKRHDILYYIRCPQISAPAINPGQTWWQTVLEK
jgi:hypothetical protein